MAAPLRQIEANEHNARQSNCDTEGQTMTTLEAPVADACFLPDGADAARLKQARMAGALRLVPRSGKCAGPLMKHILTVVTFVMGALCFVMFLITVRLAALSAVPPPSKPAHCKMPISDAPG